MSVYAVCNSHLTPLDYTLLIPTYLPTKTRTHTGVNLKVKIFKLQVLQKSVSPDTKNRKCDNLQCSIWLCTAAACAIIEVHVVITIHVQQNLEKKFQSQ